MKRKRNERQIEVAIGGFVVLIGVLIMCGYEIGVFLSNLFR